MERWLRPLATAAVLVAVMGVLAASGTAVDGAPRTALLVAAAVVLAALWGVIGGAVVGPVAAAIAVGVPTERSQVDAVFADTGATVATLASLALPLFVGTVASLGRQLRQQRAEVGRAQLDPLTGLLNRAAVETRLGRWIRDSRDARPSAGEPMFAVLYVDLDRFKVVNDTYGHDVGDRLLCAIAQLLRDHVRGDDLVARLGGDEFVVAMPGLRDRHVVAAIASKLVGLLSSPIDVGGGRHLSVSASIGIALYPSDGDDLSSLLTSADTAMYSVKAAGKNSFVFSDVRQRDQQARRREVERRLRLALDDHTLRVAYQPQIDLTSGRLLAFEALLRWDDAELGPVSPAEFVPIAEESGLIVPIGHWMLREACYQVGAWDAAGGPRVGVAVNASTLQFRQADFVDQVASALRDTNLAPERLEIEVTESILIDQFDVAVQTLRRLHRLGVRTALDDFGTGYSSLAYLQRLPIESLKIDRAFVTAVHRPTGGSTAVPIVDAIAAMGRALGKVVVAEGVETATQAAYLQRLGVDRAQGFYYGKALSALEAGRAIARQGASDALQARDARRQHRADAIGRDGDDRVELLFD